MKKLMILFLSGFVAILSLLVIGCEGNAGNRGNPGDPGDPGNPFVSPVPENRNFSLAIGNNSITIHNGAPKLYLSFDSIHANAGDTVVCQPLTGGRVPEIDGIDGDAAEWGSKFTDVTLRRLAGYDNQIHSARIRSAYDQNYIYFQVKWIEIDDSAFGLSASASVSPKRWQHGVDLDSALDNSDPPKYYYWFKGGNPPIWKTTNDKEDQDRVMFLFEITKVFWFDHDGCQVTCHVIPQDVAPLLPEANYHSTTSSKARMDVWSWSSISSDPTGHADDKYMDNRSGAALPAEDLGYIDGIKADLGLTPTVSNRELVIVSNVVTIDRPIWQAVGDPNLNVAYPLWDWQIARVDTAGWADSLASVPWFITRIPTGSRADVFAKGKFENGTWTVEFRRARNTGNGDDVKF